MTIVHDDFPPMSLDEPLSAEQQRKLGQLHWKWTIALNRAKNAPRTHYTELNKEQCEEVLKLINLIMKASTK